VGGAFVVVGLARSTGSVVFDPTLLITDVDAKVASGVLATGYTFGLFGKLALATASVPCSMGDISGQMAGQAGAISRSGLSDARFKFSVNLAGNPAMRAREFAKAPRRTIVEHRETSSDFILRGEVVGTVTDDDAVLAGKPRREVADQLLVTIRRVIEDTRAEFSARALAIGAATSAAATLVFDGIKRGAIRFAGCAEPACGG
jgi:hypothetical protein